MNKKVTTVIILFFLTITASYCQDKAYLKNGETLSGQVVSIEQGKLYFKTGRKTKKYGYEDVDKVIDNGDDNSVEYKYRDIPGVSKKVLLGELVSGKASLYVMFMHVQTSTSNSIGGKTISSYGQPLYFLFAKGKEKAMKIMPPSLVTPFKRVGKYLSDCKSVYAAVKRRELRYRDIEEIVKKYNSECTN